MRPELVARRIGAAMTDPITPEALDELQSRHSRKFLNGMVIVEVTEIELHAMIDELKEARRMLPKLNAEGHAYAKIADDMQAERDAALAELGMLRARISAWRREGKLQ